jgi:hypothetical protein
MAVNVINGTDLFVFMDDVVVGHATNHTLSMTMATRNTSNKDSGIFDTKDVGRFDVTASCEGLMVYGDNFQALMSAMRLRVPVKLEFGEKDGSGELDTSKFYAHGDFIITSFEQGAPDQDNATYNVSFEHYENFDFTPAANLNLRVVHDDDSAAVFASGGVKPYTYAWSGGGSETTFYITGKAAGGTFTCTVEDDSDPEITGEITVVLPGTE